MSSPVNNFLSLIPATHRSAAISPFTGAIGDETVLAILQKTRRSSSNTTTDSNTAEEPTLPTENDIVESPTEAVNVQITPKDDAEQPVVVQPITLHRFLKLGN